MAIYMLLISPLTGLTVSTTPYPSLGKVTNATGLLATLPAKDKMPNDIQTDGPDHDDESGSEVSPQPARVGGGSAPLGFVGP